jgi:xanthine dehydrogenase iron-sulfur cluster and FAD-binding subunit A
MHKRREIAGANVAVGKATVVGDEPTPAACNVHHFHRDGKHAGGAGRWGAHLLFRLAPRRLKQAPPGCLHLAAVVDAAEVETVEHLACDGTLSPVQEAFIDAGAFQCGYCMAGFVLMATQLIDAHPDPNDEKICHYLSGNLCRCAAYPEIVQDVKLPAQKRRAIVL